MKKKLWLVLLTALLVPLSGCGPTNEEGSTVPPSSVVASEYTMTITAIGSTTIQVSQDVTLRTTVTGTTNKNVTWSSANEAIATVTDRGVVTGLSIGTVNIRATLDIDPNCYAEIEITVEGAPAPTSLTIGGLTSTTGWVSESVALTVAIAPEDASRLVEWSSSNESVATVSATGVVSFLTVGNVDITVTSTADRDISDSVTFSVRRGTFRTDLGSSNWNFEHQDAVSDAYIDLDASSPDNSAGYNSAYFAHFTGTKFYAEATFKVHTLTANSWDWQGFGVGTGLSDSDARFFTYSPHHPGNTSNNFNKIILRDRPETWGALTNRSQVWGEHNLDDITLEDEVKVAILRNENEYYYLINDEVYWYDDTEKYDGVATYPFILSYDIPVRVSDYSLITEPSTISTMVGGAEYQKSFFAAYNNVTYVDDTDFTFNSLDTLCKDHKIRSLGDKAKLVRDFEVEFDVTDLRFNSSKSCHTGLTIQFSRYDSADVVDCISLGRSIEQSLGNAIIGRFSRWNYPQSFEVPSSIREWAETQTAVISDPNAVSHIKITRTIDWTREVATFHLFVNGVEQNFTIGSAGSVTAATSYYTGSYLIWVGGEYSTSHVTNFVFRSNIN